MGEKLKGHFEVPPQKMERGGESQLANTLRFFTTILSSRKNTKALGHFLKGAVVDWGIPHWRYDSGHVDISCETDTEIPSKNRVGIYMSYLQYPMDALGFLSREFGRKEIAKDTEKFLIDMSGFFAEAGFVYRTKQTTMVKPREGETFLKILRKVIPPNDMFPSLHVEIACHTLFQANRILNEHSKEGYGNFKRRLYRRAVDIIESCLVTKQHGLKDIAAGFFSYAARTEGFKESGIVESIIADLFKDLEESREMSREAAERIRASIREAYNDLFTSFETENKNYTQVLLAYIGEIEKQQMQK